VSIHEHMTRMLGCMRDALSSSIQCLHSWLKYLSQ
jgi:hypothetical protein